MGEVIKPVSGDGISVTTYFDLKDFFGTLKAWFKRNNYSYKELMNDEYVHGTKKNITYAIKPVKKISDYVKLEIEMGITLSDCEDVAVEKNGHKRIVTQGKIDININAFVNNDYEGKWDGRPLYYFFRVVADKFIYPGRDSLSVKQVVSDVASLKREIKAYLNMKKFE